MTTPRFLKFVPFILTWEGEVYENDPDDNGGATKYGIDQRSHPKEDIRNLTKERAYEIYFEEYWSRCRCEELPVSVGEVVMNIAVNCGPGRAGKWLQQAVSATPDGVIGPKTIAAAKLASPTHLANDLIDRTEEHYRSIGRGKLAKFLKGWLNRNNSLRKWLNVN